MELKSLFAASSRESQLLRYPSLKTEPPLSRKVVLFGPACSFRRGIPRERAVRGGRAHHQPTRSAKSTLVISGVTNVGARSPSHPTAHSL